MHGGVMPMVKGLVISLSLSLCLTIAVECLLSFALGVRKAKDYLLIVLVNIITNPLVGILLDLFYFYVSPPPWFFIAFLEIAAVFAEWLLYRGRLQYKKISPLLLSLMLNAGSYLAGLLLSTFI